MHGGVKAGSHRSVQLYTIANMHTCPATLYLHRYSGFVADYNAAYVGVKKGIVEAFYGPPQGGVYSPSVQFTLMEMGKAVLAKCALSPDPHVTSDCGHIRILS